MHAAARAVLAIAIVASFAPPAVAQFKGKTDPDWPCQQIKTPTFSLASVWAGPQLDLNSQSWRDESDVADLKAQMAQRRVPIADVEAAIADFKAKAGPDANAKLLRAFAAAFADLSQQRSQIIDGLDRIGRKQNALADRIRAENEAVQKSSDQNRDGQAPPGADSQDRLLWDLRVFNDRRQTVTYVCEAPTLIEQRIGEIARAVQKALAPIRERPGIAKLRCAISQLLRLRNLLIPLEAELARSLRASDVARGSDHVKNIEPRPTRRASLANVRARSACRSRRATGRRRSAISLEFRPDSRRSAY